MNHFLRKALTIGLIPLWLLGIYAGILVAILVVPVILLPNSEDEVKWIQPPTGDNIVDIRIAHAYYWQHCGVLGLTSAGHVYLYTVSSNSVTEIERYDVTKQFDSAILPVAFRIENLTPLKLTIENARPTPSVLEISSSAKLAQLPEGKLLTSGCCYSSYGNTWESLDAAVVENSGLWLIGGKSDPDDSSKLLRSEILVPMGSVAGISIVLMTTIVKWLHRRIWTA